jgi:hypothetical protein
MTTIIKTTETMVMTMMLAARGKAWQGCFQTFRSNSMLVGGFHVEYLLVNRSNFVPSVLYFIRCGAESRIARHSYEYVHARTPSVIAFDLVARWWLVSGAVYGTHQRDSP